MIVKKIIICLAFLLTLSFSTRGTVFKSDFFMDERLSYTKEIPMSIEEELSTPQAFLPLIAVFAVGYIVCDLGRCFAKLESLEGLQD